MLKWSEIITSRNEISVACWKEELGLAEIDSNKGKLWTATGIVRNGKIYIFLEDILFLAEIGALHLFDNEDNHISLKDIYKKVAGGSCYESFEIYRHLKSLGYIVKRHGVCWSTKGVTEITELFSTMKISEPRPTFDVDPPNSKFRKSNPGNPLFILCVNNGDPPEKKQIEDLERQCKGVPM